MNKENGEKVSSKLKDKNSEEKLPVQVQQPKRQVDGPGRKRPASPDSVVLQGMEKQDPIQITLKHLEAPAAKLRRDTSPQASAQREELEEGELEEGELALSKKVHSSQRTRLMYLQEEEEHQPTEQIEPRRKTNSMKISKNTVIVAKNVIPKSLAFLEHFMEDSDVIQSFHDDPIDKGDLSHQQQTAVQMALNEKRKLVCVEGAPGTGKTHVLAQIVFHHFKKGKLALVLGPNRKALSVIRRQCEAVLRRNKLGASLSAVVDLIGFENIRNEEETTTKEEKLSKIRIVFALNNPTSFSTILSWDFIPDVCVMDEAGRLVTCMWPTDKRINKVIVAGDLKKHFAKSCFMDNQKLVMELINANQAHFGYVVLDKQFRCHEDIFRFSNQHFYDNQLTPGKKSRKLEDRFDFSRLNVTGENLLWNKKILKPLVMFDTNFEKDEARKIATYEKKNYSNEAEAKIVIHHFRKLIKLGVSPSQIAIITPYQDQIDLVRKMAQNREEQQNMKVGLLCKFEGEGYDAVICSLVHNNPARELGVWKDLRAFNTAITRAKYHFALVGSGFMMSNETREEGSNNILQDLIEYFRNEAKRFPPWFAEGEFGEYDSLSKPDNLFGHN